MLIAGIVLIVIAAVALLTGRSQHSHARESTATETMTCGDLDSLMRGVGAEVGGGDFHSARRATRPAAWRSPTPRTGAT